MKPNSGGMRETTDFVNENVFCDKDCAQNERIFYRFVFCARFVFVFVFDVQDYTKYENFIKGNKVSIGI